MPRPTACRLRQRHDAGSRHQPMAAFEADRHPSGLSAMDGEERADRRVQEAPDHEAMDGLPALPVRHKKRWRSSISGEAFRLERRQCALTIGQAAKLLQVSDRTVRNWEAGRVGVPYSAFKLMRVIRGKELPDPSWAGWRVGNGRLWSPAGQHFDRSGLEYLWLVFQGYRAWRKDSEARSNWRQLCRKAPPADALTAHIAVPPPKK